MRSKITILISVAAATVFSIASVRAYTFCYSDTGDCDRINSSVNYYADYSSGTSENVVVVPPSAVQRDYYDNGYNYYYSQPWPYPYGYQVMPRTRYYYYYYPRSYGQFYYSHPSYPPYNRYYFYDRHDRHDRFGRPGGYGPRPGARIRMHR